MWILFALGSMIFCAAEELVEKHIVKESPTSGPWVAYSSVSLFTFVSTVVMWGMGMGESGQSPFYILMENPVILFGSVSTGLALLLVFFAYKYIGVSIEAVVLGVSSIFLFLGFASVNVFTGKLEAVKELFLPGRFIPIIVFIVLIFLLSKTDDVVVDAATKTKHKRTAILTGILIVLAACIFDASDSFICAYCLSEMSIGEMDYYMAVNLPNLLYGIISGAIAIFMSKKANQQTRFTRKNVLLLVLIGVLEISCLLTYAIGSGYDAVKFAMLYIAYPIVPLIGARIFLKERYTAKQYFCIFGIAIASIVFCLMDYV